MKRIAILLSCCLCYALSALAQASTEAYGDTIFHATFGENLAAHTVFRSFDDAGLSKLNHISALYTPYSPTVPSRCASNPHQFYGGDYSIITNSSDMMRNSGGTKYNLAKVGSCGSTDKDNTYLVDGLLDHTTGDGTGGYLIVNGSLDPGVVFRRQITELCNSSEYEFTAWVAFVHATKSKPAAKLNFEIWGENPGDAIVPEVRNSSGTITDKYPSAINSFTAGTDNWVYLTKEDQAAGWAEETQAAARTHQVQRKLLYIDAAAYTTPTYGDSVNKTVSVPHNCITATNHYNVYTDGSLYAYEGADGFWYQTTGSNESYTESSSNRLYGKVDYEYPVVALASTVGGVATAEKYYIYKSDADLYYAATAANKDAVDAAILAADAESTAPLITVDYDGETDTYDVKATPKTVGSIYSDSHTLSIVHDSATNAGGEFKGLLYTDSAATLSYAIKMGDNYYRVASGVNATNSYSTVTMASTDFSTTSPLTTDYADVYTTQAIYNTTTTKRVENVQSRWKQIRKTFRLDNAENSYLVLRNSLGNNDGNDFAVDDITFRPYTPFNMNTVRSETSVSISCVTGMVTLKSEFNNQMTPAQLAAVSPYISQYGFRFQGLDRSNGDSVWVDLPGQTTPLQLANINSNLEIDIPIATYNFYTQFRISVASSPAGFAGKCISFTSPAVDRTLVSTVPDYEITGLDVCDAVGTNGCEVGTFNIVRKATQSNPCVAAEHPYWQVTVQLPDGTIKTLGAEADVTAKAYVKTPDECTTPTP